MLVLALRGFFHFLLREDVVAANPARGTRTPTYPKRLTRHLSNGRCLCRGRAGGGSGPTCAA
jgi:site-specific recombinase XerC